MSKRRLQKTVLQALRLTGAHRVFGRVASGAGAILTFHRVRPAPDAAFTPNGHLEITPEFLGELVDWARRRDIDLVTLDEALRRLDMGAHRRFLVLTFDDGYRDNLEFALPVLSARNCPFTIYVATGFTERRVNPWWMTLEAVVATADRVEHTDGSGAVLPASSLADKRATYDILCDWLQAAPEGEQRSAIDALAKRHGFDVEALVDEAFMNWSEVKQIAGESLVTIGAHTDGHFALAKLSEQEAIGDVTKGAELLQQQLGERPVHFAYPYGFPAAVGPREYDLIAGLGFRTGVLTSPGVLRSTSAKHPTALPRISMNGYFQSVKYAEVLASGAPFLPRHLLSRKTTPPRRLSAKASAST